MADDESHFDAESDEGHAHAASCVGTIIANATDALADSSEGPSRPAERSRPTHGRLSMSIGRPTEKRPEIAAALAASRQSADLREYVKSQDFWRVPHFFRDLQADFDDEEDYIASLPNAPPELRQRVRLLAKDEREMLIQGLRQQFQRATANYLNSPVDSRGPAMECLEKIKQDIASLSHPYIFIEA
mmetsp:Transcript_18419/g.34506  ORF Transcript_18419/g.34506 Transcript_18419/m.34506 type:complete len:187 (-) Transcript_18419:188-748(-)